MALRDAVFETNNKIHELLPPGGLVSLPCGFTSLALDQAVPQNLLAPSS